MDERTLWGWEITVLQGAVVIAEKLHEDGAQISEHFRGELVKVRDRLAALIDKVKVQ